MRVPGHLAIIPDGNRRWARSQGLEPSEGHRVGIRNTGRIAAAAWQDGVEVFSFWWGSPANLTGRDPDEVRIIIEVLNTWLTDEAPALLKDWNARFDVFGRWEELAPGITAGVEAARASAGSGPRRLVLLMAYDGREELAAAAAHAPQSVAELADSLWTASLPPVDLILRTAGEPHLSAGFLLWHIAEAQLTFVDPPWPACTPEDLRAAFGEFAKRDRRFGR